MIQSLCVVLSFTFSICILHEPLYWTSALGGSFIFCSVIVLGIAKLAEVNNVIQQYSGSLLQKCGSFDIIGQKQAANLSVNTPKTTDNLFGVSGLNEPHLLRMAPICFEATHPYTNIPITITVPSFSNNNYCSNNNCKSKKF